MGVGKLQQQLGRAGLDYQKPEAKIRNLSTYMVPQYIFLTFLSRISSPRWNYSFSSWAQSREMSGGGETGVSRRTKAKWRQEQWFIGKSECFLPWWKQLLEGLELPWYLVLTWESHFCVVWTQGLPGSGWMCFFLVFPDIKLWKPCMSPPRRWGNCVILLQMPRIFMRLISPFVRPFSLRAGFQGLNLSFF